MKLPVTYEDLVNEIISYTGFSREEAEHRVWMEALEPGWNVLQDVARFGANPHEYDEKMLQVYRDGDGFIFETLVFWARPSRQRWIHYSLDRIRLYAKRFGANVNNITILMLGDGTGNDSLYLADNGLIVDYFDIPGSRTFEFATKRFEHHGLLGRRIKLISDYQSCLNRQYDIVISFEVLEHLPQPLQTIKDVHSMLKTGGIALITEDFGDIVVNLPTHLRSTSKFQGKTPLLFLRNNMMLSWYSRDVLFKPFEFTKFEERPSFGDLIRLLRDNNVRRKYTRNSNIIIRLIGRLPYIRG